MRGKLNRILAAVLVLVCGMLMFSSAYAQKEIPNATSKFVNDFANVISDEAEWEMAERAKVLHETYPEKIQVMVATIASLDGEAISDYALRMYNTYGIGLKDVNQGALILVAINDRKTWITTGSGTDDYYITDNRASELAAIGNSYFKSGDYAGGLEAIQIATIEEFNSKMNVEAGDDTDATETVNTVVMGNTSNNGETSSLDDSLYIVSYQLSDEEFYKRIDELEGMVRNRNICLFGFAGVVIILIFLYRNKEKQNAMAGRELDKYIDREEEYKYKLEEGARIVSELQKERKKLQNELNRVNARFEGLNARFEMAKRIDPQIEMKVARKIAESWDRRANCILNASTVYDDKLEKSQELMEEYEILPEEMKSFVTLAFDLRKHIKTSIDNRDMAVAKEIEEQIREKVHRIHKVCSSDYSKLSSANELYQDLNENARSFVDPVLMTSVFSMLRTSERLRDEEVRRRKYAEHNYANPWNTSSSDSSSSDSSSYDSSFSFDAGDGGASDGGGGGADW